MSRGVTMRFSGRLRRVSRSGSGRPDSSNRSAANVVASDCAQQVRALGKVIGYGINWALQDLEVDEINALLS